VSRSSHPLRSARAPRAILVALALAPAIAVGCTCASHPAEVGGAPGDASAAPSSGPSASSASASPSLAPSSTTPVADAQIDAPALDPRPLHFDTQDALLALFPIRSYTRAEIEQRGDPLVFLRKTIGPGGPAKGNQGNPAIAHHDVSRAQCLAGLAGVTLQSDEQKRRCGGAERMVPIWRGGDPGKATTCIDVFEFPNQPCELPFVWVAPVQAQLLCEMQGKRLCTQDEWNLACAGDPAGGADSIYAYGNELDLAICNTHKPPRPGASPACDPSSAPSAWATCGSDTEPSGAFPKCRSRFGVYDQHGNVAEEMTRRDPDGKTYDQLKGSAFFYVDVARKHDQRPAEGATRETYPDHCAYDPRWHVEPIDEAWHVNYHLGFRCCKSIK
jgi:hypothetical protein